MSNGWDERERGSLETGDIYFLVIPVTNWCRNYERGQRNRIWISLCRRGCRNLRNSHLEVFLSPFVNFFTNYWSWTEFSPDVIINYYQNLNWFLVWKEPNRKYIGTHPFLSWMKHSNNKNLPFYWILSKHLFPFKCSFWGFGYKIFIREKSHQICIPPLLWKVVSQSRLTGGCLIYNSLFSTLLFIFCKKDIRSMAADFLLGQQNSTQCKYGMFF